MFNKSSFFYLAVSVYLIHFSLMAQGLPIPNPSPIIPSSTSQETSNLITSNPFVPENNSPLNNAKNPTGPQSITSKSQVLQKYLQFKSIAIINKKKYFSIFNMRTNKSFWISENEAVENFRVTYYDPVNKTISITDGINSEVISIVTANETPLSVASAVPTANNKEVQKPPTPGATENKNKDKAKSPPRRRIVPVKR